MSKLSKRELAKVCRIGRPYDFSVLEPLREWMLDTPDIVREPTLRDSMIETLDYGIEHAKKASATIPSVLGYVEARNRERVATALRVAMQHAFWAGMACESRNVFAMIDLLPDGDGLKALECYRKCLAGSEKAHGTPEDRQSKASKFAQAVENAMKNNPKLNKSGAVRCISEQFGVCEGTVWRMLRAARRNGADKSHLSAD